MHSFPDVDLNNIAWLLCFVNHRSIFISLTYYDIILTCVLYAIMSASVIRRGLDLLSDDIKDSPKGKFKGKQRNLKTPSKANVMELVSTKRQGVTKQVKRLQGRLGPGKNKATVKDKRIKSAVEEFRKKQRKSHMSTNLEYFLGTGYKATYSDTMKILKQNSGRQSRNCPATPNKPSESKSFFTEDEFQQFQNEYFGKSFKDEK